MLITAAATLERLVKLTAPGAPVAPVLESLASVATTLHAAAPQLEQARASASLLREVDRVRGAAVTLHDSLADLAANDGMTTFDPAFSADDPSWDTWFAASATIVRQAAQLLGQPSVSMTSV